MLRRARTDYTIVIKCLLLAELRSSWSATERLLYWRNFLVREEKFSNLGFGSSNRK